MTDPVINPVTDVISERTTQVIAAEINMIKYQAERIYLATAIEIGKRLTEAKALLKYGEWGKWLEESVSYSQSTAERLMKVFREYGSKLLDASDSSSESAPVRNLTYSQAVILLGVPEDVREQFIIDMDIKGMTNQELRKAVNERTQVRQEKDQALQENADLQKKVEDQSGIITQLTTELANLKAQLENVKRSKAELDKMARQLKDSLESLQKSTSAKGYERMKTNFINTSLKVRANHIAFLCENLDKTVKQVKHELLQISPTDKETYIIYKNKVYDLLHVWLKDETWSRQA